MPDTLLVPEYLNTALVEDSIYYKIENIPIHKFIHPPFVDLFVKKGRPQTILVTVLIYTIIYVSKKYEVSLEVNNFHSTSNRRFLKFYVIVDREYNKLQNRSTMWESAGLEIPSHTLVQLGPEILYVCRLASSKTFRVRRGGGLRIQGP